MMNIVVKTETMGTAKAKSEISALKETIGEVGKQARGFAGKIGSGLSAMVSGTLGVGLGAGIGVMIAEAFMNLVSAVKEATIEAIHMADSIGDSADIAGTTRGEMFALQKAAALAGVAAGKPGAAMSAISERRSEALNNPALAALFKQYGVSGSMLADNKVSNLSIAQAIAKSLGSGGMQAGDRDNLGKLLGRRPEQLLAVLRRYDAQGASKFNEYLESADKAAAMLEEIEFAKKEAALRMAAGAADAILQADKNTDAMARVMARTPGFGGYAPGNAPATPAPGSTAPAPPPFEPEVPRTAATTSSYVKEAAKGGTHAATVDRVTVDALARIGLYRGGAQNPQLAALQRQISLQQAALRELRSLNNVMLRATTDDFPFAPV